MQWGDNATYDTRLPDIRGRCMVEFEHCAYLSLLTIGKHIGAIMLSLQYCWVHPITSVIRLLCMHLFWCSAFDCWNVALTNKYCFAYKGGRHALSCCSCTKQGVHKNIVAIMCLRCAIKQKHCFYKVVGMRCAPNHCLFIRCLECVVPKTIVFIRCWECCVYKTIVVYKVFAMCYPQNNCLFKVAGMRCAQNHCFL